MYQVTQKQFFDFIGPLDVTPNPEKEYTDWKTRGQQLIGKSIPGYLHFYTNGKPIPKQYFLTNKPEA
jgi:hypothetical protein